MTGRGDFRLDAERAVPEDGDRTALRRWHQLPAEEVVRALASDAERGLDSEEARRRLAVYGPNELADPRRRSAIAIFFGQLRSVMVLVLLAAAAVSLLVGDPKDTLAILLIVVLNAVLGFSQEYRAERAMAALRQLAVPIATVRRDGELQRLPSRELVPGDIVVLEAGAAVPADGRLLEVANLRVHEASLTGESVPVDKHAGLIEGADVPLAERTNMVFMGTTVVAGRGIAIVTETGMRTEMGRVAGLLEAVEPQPTPLQRRMDQFGRVLVVAVLLIIGVIFVLGLLRQQDPHLLFLTAVSLGVAAVPEGLPAVVTIALALGAQRMLRRRALVRQLAAVETLGSVTVICSDKTGTITENRMAVSAVFAAGSTVSFDDLVPSASGGAEPGGTAFRDAVWLVLAAAALCNDATLDEDGAKQAQVQPIGDPTEVALVLAAARLGMRKPDLDEAFPRVNELPFDAARKRMTTVHRGPRTAEGLPATLESAWQAWQGWARAPDVAFTKGALEALLPRTSSVWVGTAAEPLDERWQARLAAANDDLAQRGMRVLAVAARPISESEVGDPGRFEERLVILGLVGMIDPPRPEVRAAVERCRTASIRPIMITGDHPLTAQAIAQQVGIAADGRVLTGPEIDRLSEQALGEAIEQVSVFARVAPEHKLQIVRALRSRGQIVAMTGDGINDAPALKTADIGVAMGLIGTDVAREAADIVLLDDNFATIVAAVEEGRIIYDNIRKFVRFLMTTNSAELWVMLLGPLIGMPLPLLPLQILWVNLVTDGLPALALSVEPAERDVMRRPPIRPEEGILARGLGLDVLLGGLLMAVIVLGIGYGFWQSGEPHWQTMVFTVLVFAQMANVLAVRSERNSLFQIGLSSNRPLLGAVVLTISLQLVVVYAPVGQAILGTAALPLPELALAALLSTLVFWAAELKKWVRRRAW